MDLRITHERFGSSSDPSLNGNLHYPNGIDRSLHETDTDKIRKYHSDFTNNPPSTVSFMPTIFSTSGRLHSEFIRLLFLQTHRETDRFFFTVLGVQLDQKPVDYSTSTAQCSLHILKQKLASPSSRLMLYVLTLTLTGRLSLQEHILTHHTLKPRVY